MARPREFAEDKALDGAINIFWKQGYGTTNMPDLLQAMGLTRGSFYAAFSDKHSVYVAALKRYEDVYLAELLEKLSTASSTPISDRLMVLYNQIDTTGPLNQRRGCIICNAMVEFGTTDPSIAQSANRMAHAIETTLCNVLKKDGIHQETAQAKAKVLLQLYFGAQALSKSGADISDFKSMIEAIVG